MGRQYAIKRNFPFFFSVSTVKTYVSIGMAIYSKIHVDNMFQKTQ